MSTVNAASRLTRRDAFRLATVAAVAAASSAACGQGARGLPTAPAPPTAPPPAQTTATPASSAAVTQPPLRPTITALSTPAKAALPTAISQDPSPDLLLVGGKVITVDASDSIAQAVAVKNGLIQAVGASDKIRLLAGKQTTVIDLKGKTVTPGLIDAHCHLLYMGLSTRYFESFMPPEIKTIKDMQAKVAALAAKTPAGEWIKGIFLGMGGPPPTKADLDPVSPKHPVWMMQQGGHYATANGVALKMAGLTASTPNPSGGVIARDSSGQLTGVLYNHRAMDLVRRLIEPYSPELMQESIVETQKLFAACGVTSFHDNNARGVEAVGAYIEADKQGKLILRSTVHYTLEWPNDVNTALDQIKRIENPMLRVVGYKFLIDGEIPTAYCHEPHGGIAWNMPTWEAQSFKLAIRKMHETGMQISVHCIGDAATDLTLDAYQEAMKASPRSDARHRIEHCVLCTPASTQRMKDLGVVVCTQPAFIRLSGDTWPTVFGAERAKRLVVTKEWLAAGVPLALGSDAPTGPWYTPQATLAGAVARLTLTNQTMGRDQALTIQEALRAHTMVAAYAAHEERMKGSIETGKLADLAVWNDDPYALTPAKMLAATINMTIVGGKIVYQEAKT